jgi:hypothetical protein
MEAEAITPEQQQQVYEELAKLTRYSQAREDGAGNIIGVGFTNHPSLAEDDEPEGAYPGLNDAAMEKLSRLPWLESIALQSQPLTDSGYQLIGLLPRIEAVTISDPVYQPGLSHAYVMSLENLKEQLEILELEQSQAIDNSALPLLWGYPKLRFLAVDGVSADDSVVEFARGTPALTGLELWNTALSDDDLHALVNAAQGLEYLLISPAPGDPDNPDGPRLTAASLRHLKELPNLRFLALEGRSFLPLPFENGLEHLADIPNLENVSYPRVRAGMDEGVPEDVTSRLQEAAPNLKISDDRLDRPTILGYDWRLGIL